MDKVKEFSQKIERDLNTDKHKSKWENSDISWWLAQLASEVNLISQLLNKNSLANIEKSTISIASYALIITYLQKQKRVNRKI